MAELRKIGKKELKKVLRDHKTWIKSNHKEGKKANLHRTDLSDANLSLEELSNVSLFRKDLVSADLNFLEADLSFADLSDADLSGASLRGTNLMAANLSNANFIGADLTGADLLHANLCDAKLSYAILIGVNLEDAVLSSAELNFANLVSTNFSSTFLDATDFNDANCNRTKFSDLDLSNAVGLDTIKHHGPSSISIDTIIKSKGKIPEKFLRGCGVPDEWIDYIPSLTTEAIQYYSCFISYSHKDEKFAQKLYDDLQNAGIRCWFAPEEMKGGKKLFDQISDAIRVQDKLLLVLSESSLKSNWVETEIRNCRKEELKTGQKKLFPIRLVDFKAIEEWECFNADTGKDLAVELREYFIPDFSNWTNKAKYQKALQRLIQDLKSDKTIDEKEKS